MLKSKLSLKSTCVLNLSTQYCEMLLFDKSLKSISVICLRINGTMSSGFLSLKLIFPQLILSKAISYLLKKYYSYTFYAIIGFVISTIPALLTETITLNSEFFIGVILSIIACFITILFSKNCD